MLSSPVPHRVLSCPVARRAGCRRSCPSEHLAAFVVLTLLFVCGASQQADAGDKYEAYYLKLNSYPEDATNDWNPNGTETQGVTHDEEYWYFTSTDTDRGNGHLWRIPVSVDLNQNVQAIPGAEKISMTDIPALSEANYWHWGDPDHYQQNGTGYLFVPMTSDAVAPTCITHSDCTDGRSCVCVEFLGCSCRCSDDSNCPLGECVDSKCKADAAIGIFTTSPLSFVNFEVLPEQDSTGWCAISPIGDLYSSVHELDSTIADPRVHLRSYQIAWPNLVDTTRHDALSFRDHHPLTDLEGFPFTLHNMQGGEFSPSGQLLYISSGSGECHNIIGIGGGGGIFPTDGIHVFDAGTWQEIQRSTNHVRKSDYICSEDTNISCPGIFPYRGCGRCSNDAETICVDGNIPPTCDVSAMASCVEDDLLGLCRTSHFDYSFDNGCTCQDPFQLTGGSQTPEGLTIWDLDDGRAPGVRGQLHVLVNFYNRFAACADAIGMQNFGGELYVDAINGSTPEWGDPFPGTPLDLPHGRMGRPFKTVTEAYNFYPVWDGAELVIGAGSYPETITFSRRIRVVAHGGRVIIGR